MKSLSFSLAIVLSLSILVAFAAEPERNDYSKDKVLFVTATAHLDTQWRWTIIDTITKYIPVTLSKNFDLFEKFPSYIFSFEGAFRYMLMKEYYPDEYERLKKYIDTGRWAVCGSWVDAVDTHIQSPETLIRQTLYGNGYFKKEFGKSSVDIFLPDCFGFGYVLPSVAAHCGLKGFSSQKLTWGSAIGIPFDLGLWEGVDGSSIIAALNPDDYVATMKADLRESEKWNKTIQKQGEISNLFVGYKYFGVGDEGGGPDDESVSWLEKSINTAGPFKVVSAPADLLYREIFNASKDLPRYKGELLMTTHGTGCYTSQTAMKRWNRQNERMAAAAEHASVIADWLGSLPYQDEKIYSAWIRFLWHGFHDDLTGTSIPQAYTYSWNDEIISMNMFDSVIRSAASGVIQALDTKTDGIPIVIYNPLAMARTDIVEATLNIPKGFSQDFILLNEKDQPVPLQINGYSNETGILNIVFSAKVPSMGFTVYKLVRRAGNEKFVKSPDLGFTYVGYGYVMTNDNYQVIISSKGDIDAIEDLKTKKEVIASPVRLQLLNDYSTVWPAWEIIYKDITAAPRSYVSAENKAEMKVIENGPVRSVVEIDRQDSGSSFKQKIVLSAGDSGDRIEIQNVVDWKSKGTLLKASFPFSVSNPIATYDLGMGVIERGNNNEKKYEVPAQKWADITSADGEFGVAVITDGKYGWDKPADNELRLSLIHTPETRGSYRDQATQDIGIHRFSYAIASHKGCWRKGDVPAMAERVDQPLIAFIPSRHSGSLGRSFSFIDIKGEGIVLKALKKAENGEGIVVRVQEQYGKPVKDAEIAFASPIVSAKEVNGQEEPIGEAKLVNGKVFFDINPFSPKTFLVKIKNPSAKFDPPSSSTLKLEYDVDASSADLNKKDGDFDGNGTTYPAELFPEMTKNDGITFRFGGTKDGEKNTLACKGQYIDLPDGDFDRIYILAASINGDQDETISLGGREYPWKVQSFDGFIGQWDSRVVDGEVQSDIEQIVPAYIKKDKLAFVSTHLHKSDGNNMPYSFGYIFEYSFYLPQCAKRIKLPDNGNIRIFAITLAKNPYAEPEPAQELYDSADGVGVKIKAPERLFLDSAVVELAPSHKGGEIRYTIDGSQPEISSAVYSSPIKVTDTMTIRAKVFGNGNEAENKTISVTLTKAVLQNAVTLKESEQGLNYEFFEGKWRETKDMLATTVVRTGKSADIAIDKGEKKEYFGYRFTGFIKIDKDGIYKFYLKSDDGSVFLVNGQKVVDNDGLHSAESEESGAIGLKAGMHPIEILYFDRGWDKSLELSFSGPEKIKQPVNPSMFFRSKNSIVSDQANN